MRSRSEATPSVAGGRPGPAPVAGCRGRAAVPSVRNMTDAHAPAGLPWRLVLVLGAFALIRPLSRMLDVSGAVPPAAIAVGGTVLITAVWVAAVLVLRAQRPFLTLLAAGLAYAVFSILLAAVVSPLMTGRLQGPLATPLALPAVLFTNAIWGAAAGGIAAGLKHLCFREGPRRRG